MEKINLEKADFNIVSDSYRITAAEYDKIPAVAALLEGKTVAVPENTATDKLYRFAKSHKYRLRKHKIEGGLIALWFEPLQEIGQHDGIAD